MKLEIKPTSNPTVIKFEFPEFITKENFEFKNIDDAKDSELAKKLFYLPFVKTVYISGNFIAIERFSIVEWEDVQDAVAEQIQEYIDSGAPIVTAQPAKTLQKPIQVYGEVTPNPSALKFVVSRLLTKTAAEYKNIDQTASSPLARDLFTFPYVKEVFIDENYVSVTKYDAYNWDSITLELRSFIREYLANGGQAIIEDMIDKSPEGEKQKVANFENLDVTSQQIVNILEEYVKPAVQSDGGNILFDSFDPETKRVKVVLQGACNGCPSSTFTLKNGIENMLKDMLKDEQIIVEALNA